MPVTFALLCYNQEPYIRTAVRSTLSQVFESLEIIILDDCSTDATFDIIQDEVTRYEGRNTVRTFRNAENLGYAENSVKAASIARGELLIVGDGDDIALPNRTSRLVETWVANNASLLTSNAMITDVDSTPCGLLNPDGESRWISAAEIAKEGWKRTYLGATMAIHRDVFDRFKPLDRLRVYGGMDHVLPFRASILNGVFYLGETLVQWRQHDFSIGKSTMNMRQSNMTFEETRLAYNLSCRLCMLDDLEYFASESDEATKLENLQEILKARIIEMARQWTQSRNMLLAEGRRSTWVDRADYEQNPITVDKYAGPYDKDD